MGTMLWIDAGSRYQVYFLNMKKILTICLIIFAFNNNVSAQNKVGEKYPGFTFGLEWGYTASLFTIYHYNFYAPEGFRVDEEGMLLGYSGNADVYLHFGWDLSPVWNLSFYMGYAGISKYHKALPVSVRGTRYFGTDHPSDRWFAFSDIGSGISLKTPVQEILTLKIGGGYQIVLSEDTRLNFMIALRSTFTHPGIIFYDNKIPHHDTNRNNAAVNGLSLGIGLDF